MRRSSALLAPGVSDSVRAAWASLRVKLSSELGLHYVDGSEPDAVSNAVSLALAVLRTHSFRCQSILLSEAAAELEPPPGSGPGTGSGPNLGPSSSSSQSPYRPRPPRRSRRTLQAAADALAETEQLLSLYREVLDAEDSENQDQRAANDTLLRELGLELEASGVLDAWSRLLLLLTACEGWQDEAAKQLHAMANCMSALAWSEETNWQQSQPRLLLSSPCLAYLLTSHVVGLCAALDEGHTYGMPREEEREEEREEREGREASAAAPALATVAAPLFGATGLRLRRRGSPEGAGTVLAQWALSLWAETLETESLELRRTATRLLRLSEVEGRQELRERLEALHRSAHDGWHTRPFRLPKAYRLGVAVLEPLQAEGLSAAAQAELAALRRRVELAAMPPLNSAAAFELAMRLAARAAEALSADGDAASAAAPPEAVAGPGPSSRPPRAQARRAPSNTVLRVALREAEDLGAQALLCSRGAIGEWWYRSDSTCPPAVAARLGRWWAALAAFVDGVVRRHSAAYVPRSTWRGLEARLAVVVTDTDEGKALPAHPTPCVAAALEAGYLPRLTNVLRGLLHEPESLDDLLDPGIRAMWAWRQLLAFGPARDTAEVVEAAALLLERAMRALPPPGGASEGGATEDIAARNLCETLDFAMSIGRDSLRECECGYGEGAAALASAVPGEEQAMGAEAGPKASTVPSYTAGSPRRWLLLSYAIGRLLPCLLQARAEVCLCQNAQIWSNEAPGKVTAHLAAWMALIAAATKRATLLRVQAEAQAGGLLGGQAEGKAGGPPPGAAQALADVERLRYEEGDWRGLLCDHLPDVMGAGLELFVRGAVEDVDVFVDALIGIAWLAPRELAEALSQRPAAAAGLALAHGAAAAGAPAPVAGEGPIAVFREALRAAFGADVPQHAAGVLLRIESMLEALSAGRIEEVERLACEVDAQYDRERGMGREDQLTRLARAAAQLVPPSGLVRELGLALGVA
ncbi:hypothetical protein GPECTOR_36g93 [Gonium pectorale]|uniref:Uncharacterized protein n=1 Tax=Gonium pectorale TaxID=33097 RepID=A0A150GC09_GONPE|nr:hypothetical protein GPECTOR_36g93 [Gonium pectorale]|eukprot:KXZ47372.1 hypothetical protein GPECTOR_36g93 [Gonium pectorale]